MVLLGVVCVCVCVCVCVFVCIMINVHAYNVHRGLFVVCTSACSKACVYSLHSFFCIDIFSVDWNKRGTHLNLFLMISQRFVFLSYLFSLWISLPAKKCWTVIDSQWDSASSHATIHSSIGLPSPFAVFQTVPELLPKTRNPPSLRLPVKFFGTFSLGVKRWFFLFVCLFVS